MKAVILAAGPIADDRRVQAVLGAPDLVICADGGARHAARLGLKPDVIVGDFDSAPPGTAGALERQGVTVVRLPTDKDWTDTEMAVQTALERGATRLLLVGCTGERLDHTLTNLQILGALPPGVVATLVDGHNIIQLVRPGDRLEVDGLPGELISLVPASPVVTGVTIAGVKWPLMGAELRWGVSLGVSNQFCEPRATVSVETGYLFVIKAWDQDDLPS